MVAYQIIPDSKTRPVSPLYPETILTEQCIGSIHSRAERLACRLGDDDDISVFTVTIVVIHLHGAPRQHACHTTQVAPVIRQGEAVGIGLKLLIVDDLHQRPEVLKQKVRVVEVGDGHARHTLEAVECPAEHRLSQPVDAVSRVLLGASGIVDAVGITRHHTPGGLQRDDEILANSIDHEIEWDVQRVGPVGD